MSKSQNDVWSNIHNPNNPATMDDWADVNNPNNERYIGDSDESDEIDDSELHVDKSGSGVPLEGVVCYWGYSGKAEQHTDGKWRVSISNGVHTIEIEESFDSAGECEMDVTHRYSGCKVEIPPIVLKPSRPSAHTLTAEIVKSLPL